jgi:enoyl-CoA hydratase
MSPLVLRSEADGLCTLTLNRPDKLNALNEELFRELDRHVVDIAGRANEIGLVLIRGAGRAFSAGNDLGAMAVRDESRPPGPPPQARTIERLATLPQPVIAAVHGHCLTGGLELALAADMIVASESARFGDTHSRWGLTPKWGLSQRLPRRVGRSKAIEMVVTSRMYTGADAVVIGLANLCFADDRFEEELATLTAGILAGSWFTHRANKRLMLETEGLPLAQGLAHEFYRSAGASPDSTERIAAFRDRMR